MILTKSEFPGDHRVEKEAFSLIEAGHRVFVACDGRTGQSEVEKYRGIYILRIVSPPLLLRKLNSLLYLLSFFNILWFRFLEKYHREFVFEALHVHDLPLSATALRFGNQTRLPVVLDLHENYPFALQSFGNHSPSLQQRIWKALFYNQTWWQRYERRVLQKVDRVIVVVREMGERIASLGIPSERIVVVGNTVETASFGAIPLDRDLVDKYKEHFVISYVGGLDRYRRIDTVIRAMPEVVAQIPNALLLIVGETDRRPEYKALAKDLNLENVVKFEGWQPFEKVPTYLALSDIGVIPEERNEQNNNSMPNKLWQYMFMGKPVIVSDCLSLRQLVEETGGGVVCDADIEDAQTWAQCIISLHSPELRKRIGERGYRAVIEKYNWSVDARRLVRLYESLRQPTLGSLPS